MRKVLLMLTLSCFALTGTAQESSASTQGGVVTNSFFDNWFVQGSLSIEAFYSDQEDGRGYSKSPLKGFRSNISPSVAIGKWFSPEIGMRTKLTAPWGRSVSSENSSDTGMKFFCLQEQVLFNLHNLIAGYDENRLWNAIPYVGFGMLRNFDDNVNAHGFSFGLLNTFKIDDKWSANVELGLNLMDDDIEGVNGTHANYATTFSKTDRFFAFEVGVTYNLGKSTWKKANNN